MDAIRRGGRSPLNTRKTRKKNRQSGRPFKPLPANEANGRESGWGGIGILQEVTEETERVAQTSAFVPFVTSCKTDLAFVTWMRAGGGRNQASDCWPRKTRRSTKTRAVGLLPRIARIRKEGGTTKRHEGMDKLAGRGVRAPRLHRTGYWLEGLYPTFAGLRVLRGSPALADSYPPPSRLSQRFSRPRRASWPPSITIVWPVRKSAWSEARYATIAAMSGGNPTRPIGTIRATSSRRYSG